MSTAVNGAVDNLKKLNGIPTGSGDGAGGSEVSNTTKNASDAITNSTPPLDINTQLPTFVDFLPESAIPYWRFIQEYPIAEALIIILLFWMLAYVIRRYVLSLIGRLTEHTKSDLDNYVFDQLRAPVFNTVVLLGIIIATKSAGFVTGLASYLSPIILTMIVLILVRAVMNVSSTIISSISRDEDNFKNLDSRTEPLLIITSKLLSVVIAAYITLVIWGINPVGLLASAGIVGIAFGFAAKDTLANLFSGIFILADRPYKLGDYVNLASGERGKITYIGIRSTRLMTRDDIEITIPNGVIGNEKVINESGGPQQKMRIRLPLQCSYDADLQQVHDTLMAVAQAEDNICKFPAPRVRFRGFGESGIDVQLMGWIEKPEDRGRISHIMVMAIHQAFKQNNLEIPYPKRDIKITQNIEDKSS